MKEKIEMLEEVPRKKEKRKISSIVVLILFIIAFACSIFLIYNVLLLDSIENLLRYIFIGIISITDLILLIKTKNIWKNKVTKKKKKPSKRIGFSIFLVIYSFICFGLGYLISYVYSQLDGVNKKYITYSSSLVVLSDNEANKVSDIKDYKVAILKDTKSPEGYIIPQEIIKKYKLHDENDIVEYDSYTEMIADLYTEDLDAIFLSSEYASIYSSISGYQNIATETKKICSKSKKMLKSKTSKFENQSTGKSIKEPFTILLMGVDSTSEVLTKNAVANGDALILITFNPKTLNATMLSIPRDSYVPIACWPGKDENKITHSAAYGTDCMINTIEQFFNVSIDYYAKINFKGLVNLVNALGGIDVEVPQDLCTDNSNREDQVCIKAGYQHLDGEGALVLARNRKQLVNGDFGRGQNQQLVIQAMLQKVKEINSVNQFTKIFNSISNSLDTNLTTKQILSFYSIAKDILKTQLTSDNSNIVSIDQLYLQGQSAMIYDKRMRMSLYNYVPNIYSRNDITKAMKINLELLEHKESKSFSFSINEPYEKKIIGYGPYKSSFNPSKYPKPPKDIEEDDDEEVEEKEDEKENSKDKVIYGCTNKKATNYNKKATEDDGSCILKDTTADEDEDEDEDEEKEDNNSNTTPDSNSKPEVDTKPETKPDTKPEVKPSIPDSGNNEESSNNENKPGENSDSTENNN